MTSGACPANRPKYRSLKALTASPTPTKSRDAPISSMDWRSPGPRRRPSAERTHSSYSMPRVRSSTGVRPAQMAALYVTMDKPTLRATCSRSRSGAPELLKKELRALRSAAAACRLAVASTLRLPLAALMVPRCL